MNMIIIKDTDKKKIADMIAGNGISRVHATNGAYSFPTRPSAATTLVGYQYLRDKGVYRPGDAALIAVNSHTSLARGIQEKIAQGSATHADIDKIEDQMARAAKPANSLTIQMQKFHPRESVIVCFYDEATPTEIYESLASDGRIRICSLHKNGFGTDPQAGRIEGAEFAENVFGFPLPNDGRPLYDDITRKQTDEDFARVQTAELKTAVGPHGKPYITPDFTVLIPLAAGLEEFAPKPSAGRASPVAPSGP